MDRVFKFVTKGFTSDEETWQGVPIVASKEIEKVTSIKYVKSGANGQNSGGGRRIFVRKEDLGLLDGVVPLVGAH